MTITYSCIANGRSILAELALTGGSYKESTAIVLRQVLLKAEQKSTIQMGSFVYHTLLIDGITYLCATDNALDTVTPSAFLKNVSDAFVRNPLLSQDYFPTSNAIEVDFQQVLGKYMVKYNNNEDDGSILTLKSQISDVKSIMTKNIDKVLQSEEKLNSLSNQMDETEVTAKTSQKTKLLKRILWKHFQKMTVITLAIFLLIIILLSTNIIPI
ncbi:uncharacterized protein LOC126032203 [Suncus etruscus]|uniref:uncharacterized protein LOC126032203 n=1 Tax=Suncus etruscus TaxID=109475 RepID=UPI0021105CE0|nr:uncharacterized protein LOC126032203 [Suncus etruscus]